jgi:hypothetical protein
MKHIKMLALAAVAAGALMAFIGAGTASATTICSTTIHSCPAGQIWPTTVLDFTIPSGQSANLVTTEGESIDKCTASTVKGTLTNGSTTTTPSGPVEELTWTSCTFPTKTLKTASLECHLITGTSNCTLTSKSGGAGHEEFEVTINTVFFGSCIYGVSNGVSLGDITEGTPPVFHANAVATKKSGSNFACPETSKWTATYELTGSSTTFSVST